MKGTDKQIAFAESLRYNFNKEMDDLINICPDQFKDNWIKAKENYNVCFDEAYAGDVINLLKGNNEHGQKWYKSLIARINLNGDELCGKIRKEVLGR